MATAAEVISDTLAQLLVRQSEAPLQPDEFASGVRALNNMMASWADGGLPLGYTAVDSLSDEVTVPDSAIEAIEFNLALRLAPQFGSAPSQLIMINAKESLNALRRSIILPPVAIFPDTLPIGSGNECNTDIRFYPGDADGIESETSVPIITELDTSIP